MKTNFTKGEWTSSNANNTDYIDIDCNGNRITSVFLLDPTSSLLETEANANLITNAPKLYNASYAALQAIYSLPKKRRDVLQFVIDDLVTALNKANGTIQ